MHIAHICNLTKFTFIYLYMFRYIFPRLFTLTSLLLTLFLSLSIYLSFYLPLVQFSTNISGYVQNIIFYQGPWDSAGRFCLLIPLSTPLVLSRPSLTLVRVGIDILSWTVLRKVICFKFTSVSYRYLVSLIYLSIYLLKSFISFFL